MCQYPNRCNRWINTNFQCVENFVYGATIADCTKCQWRRDADGFSVE
jgi:hypothetical protein